MRLAVTFALLISSVGARAEWYRGLHDVSAPSAPFDAMGYVLYLPSGPGPWPLIVSLHGKGQEGEDEALLFQHGLPRIIDEGLDLRVAVLAPQMPVGLPWDYEQYAQFTTLDTALWQGEDGISTALAEALGVASSGPGTLVLSRERVKVIYTSVDGRLEVITVFRGQDELTVSRLQWRVGDAVIEILDHVLTAFDIDARRVYLTGISAGGFGAFHLPIQYPGRFAATVPIAGGGNPDLAPLMATPAWAFHGTADRINDPYYTETMVNAIEAAGGDVRLTLFEGIGHNAWDAAYDDEGLFDWLLEHTLPVSSAQDSTDSASPDASGQPRLQPSYPNPANPMATIPFELTGTGVTTLTLYSVTGQRVATLVKGVRHAGHYQLRWGGRDEAGRDLASGVYFLRLTSGGHSASSRLLLVR